MAPRLLLALAALLVITAVAWSSFSDDPGPVGAPQEAGEASSAARAGAAPPPPEREDAAPARPEADAFEAAIGALEAAIARGEAAPAAAALRRLLRTDGAALVAAYAALLHADTDAQTRRALAMVLGTLSIDGVDAVLLAAVEQFGDEEETLVALIAALGALRDPPDEDDVFDMEAAPHFAAHGPGGMGITVRNVLDDPAVEAKLGELLLDPERVGVRLAAARAMQFSVDREFTRTRFRTALASELNDGVAALLGQNLGVWTRRKLGDEAQHIVDEVVQAANRPGFDEYRLRMETALHESSFGGDTAQLLQTWAQPGMSFEMRTFAYAMLLGQRPADPASRAAIVRAAASDPDVAVRDHALSLLMRLPPGEDSLGVLRSVLASSPDWTLRSTALTSMANLLTGAARARMLETYAADADQRIARRARRLQGPR